MDAAQRRIDAAAPNDGSACARAELSGACKDSAERDQRSRPGIGALQSRLRQRGRRCSRAGHDLARLPRCESRERWGPSAAPGEPGDESACSAASERRAEPLTALGEREPPREHLWREVSCGVASWERPQDREAPRRAHKKARGPVDCSTGLAARAKARGSSAREVLRGALLTLGFQGLLRDELLDWEIQLFGHGAHAGRDLLDALAGVALDVVEASDRSGARSHPDHASDPFRGDRRARGRSEAATRPPRAPRRGAGPPSASRTVSIAESRINALSSYGECLDATTDTIVSLSSLPCGA